MRAARRLTGSGEARASRLAREAGWRAGRAVFEGAAGPGLIDLGLSERMHLSSKGGAYRRSNKCVGQSGRTRGWVRSAALFSWTSVRRRLLGRIDGQNPVGLDLSELAGPERGVQQRIALRSAYDGATPLVARFQARQRKP